MSSTGPVPDAVPVLPVAELTRARALLRQARLRRGGVYEVLAVLVQTGKYRPGDEARLAVPPTHVAVDLAAGVDWLLGAGVGTAAPSC